MPKKNIYDISLMSGLSGFPYKVISAGDGGVGKTTLLHRYIHDRFIADTLMTLGVEFFTKEMALNNSPIKLQLWDFGGEEQFRFMLNKYMLGAKGALVMFDLTRLTTLKNIKDWIQICECGDPKIVKILIGAKLDLKEKISVTEEDALDVKDRYNFIDYIKISSKTGENVNLVFDVLVKKMLETYKI